MSRSIGPCFIFAALPPDRHVCSFIFPPDNESTSENNAIAFVANADLDGNSSIGLESDGDLHYNPSTGTVTATAFVGDGSNLTGITASTIGTLSGANAISFRDTDLAINSSTDGQMDINADVTLDIQAPTTALSGDITVSGNDISFGNSETISNASDNVIAITAIARDDKTLLILGIAFAILLMAFFATAIVNLLTKFRWLSYLGLAFLIYLSGKMTFDGWLQIYPFLIA